ncbi:catechol 2,3-dioxygenase-like lactoylglutathione lyase family enzyme [Amycolatopsis lexingtonensis]|uniref:Catechol 2,3-dioxygenase-like lactoylglutathione lyase family enzyme n=1 Tax=Amycolatopsis lexingtonensis TaxID=218822 RepID=A0ABR9HSG8_9PSEU|nr:VOC family protein [Amycolatopsis lexingtonensis]MBE1493865.1 catechol 2,3-dioxygenase-like lactoylglutathione lyase family enzyme [Amycolatopsis lexingtonensis]
MDMKLEVVVLPVTDVDRTKHFYKTLGWREDADIVFGASRIVQLTPPGSPTSVHFGNGITDASPGSVRGTYLVVDDIEAARAELEGLGADVSEVFHRDSTGAFAPGAHPDRGTYSSFASFSDPDGNTWLLQEVTDRLPGRVDGVAYGSVGKLEQALRDAAAAHGEHEKETGQYDAEWPTWYARYMAEHQDA